MSAYNPKLDFFRVKLNYKGGEFKTFRDFTIEVLNKKHVLSNAQLLVHLSDHLVSSLRGDKAVDNRTRKQVRWLNKKANQYIAYKPTSDANHSIIYGVISGGRFGRNGMITTKDINDDEGSTSILAPDKAIHKYAYFTLYAPMDHDEGCLIIHSNSRDESIADIFIKFLSKLFAQGNYKKPTVSRFCPSYFQELFRKNSFLKQINLKASYVDENIDSIGVQDSINEYDVQILITPHRKSGHDYFSIAAAKELLPKLQWRKKQDNPITLDKFGTSKVTMEDVKTKHVQTFEIDSDEIDLCPIVDIRSVLNDADFELDGTPKFDVLHRAVIDILEKQIIPELRQGL